MNEFSYATGELQEFDAQLAISPVKGNPFEAENFYPADGFFMEATGCEPGFSRGYWGDCMPNKKTGPSKFDGADTLSYAVGRPARIKRRAARRSFRQEGKQQRRELVGGALKSRQEARQLRSQAKLETAKGQRAAGESMGKDDVTLAQAISAPVTPKTGMTTTTKVLIGVGVVAVLGIGAYFLMKGKK